MNDAPDCGTAVSPLRLFTGCLLAGNQAMAPLFRAWSWTAGMEFQAERFWWGQRERRSTLHEGVDLACFADGNGVVHSLPAGLMVPVLFPGELVRQHRDYLATSLYIRHSQATRSGRVLYTVYGHLLPLKSIAIGSPLAAGRPVGRLAPYGANRTVPLHIHFTLAWVAETVSPPQLNWQLLNDSSRITLVDPRREGLLHPAVL